MRLSIVVVLSVVVVTRCVLRTDQRYWKDLALNELDEALNREPNLGTAKNVILFIGDGMDVNTVTATRMYKGGESHRLAFEKFPHVGVLKTYSANKMVPDSAASATALLCGVKANQETVGVDATVKHKDCSSSLNPTARLQSLAALALKAGKSTGFVTTTRVTHATPGPMYAHSADRSWECEDKMPADAAQCKDIARQLVEDWPGKDFQVIMGGGMQSLVSNVTGTPANPLDTWSCRRQDGRDLVDTYRRDKDARNLKYSVVTNNQELRDLDVDNTDYLLGVFANGHLPYDEVRDHGPAGAPGIYDMVEAAIKVLRKNDNGYFLMVEGGMIDMAHHRGWARRAIDEAAAMELAVQVANNMTDERDTLLVVTSDHGHTLSINGYPLRGSSVFGIAQPSDYDRVNYTTLSYSTGGPNSFQFQLHTIDNETTVIRRDPSLEDTEDPEYVQVAAIRLQENAHGGGDVLIYARGPQAHLFHNVHEQHYVYHAISYIAKLGPYTNHASYKTASSASLIFTCVTLVLNCVLKL